VETIRGRGDTKASVVLESGIGADLRVVAPREFPFALAYFTGSKEHNTTLRARAQERGLKLNEYGLFRGEQRVACTDEAAIYAALDLQEIPPELREDLGEFDTYALGASPPTLIEAKDLVGIVHAHSTWSDGKQSIEEMADAARATGAKYFGVTDHSQAAAYAGGLTPDEVRAQHREIDVLNRRRRGFRILKGIEVDIFTDGSLDYDDDLLDSFDFVIASVHSGFKLPESEMMERLTRAFRHPAVHIFGHPTGRLLLQRDGYAVDMDRLARIAVENGVALEINAHPTRLDADWRVIRGARSLGVTYLIGPDAHEVEGYDIIGYGVDVARKGGLTADDVINTRDADGFLKGLRQLKRK
jgi:DNA polymerase (family 10)